MIKKKPSVKNLIIVLLIATSFLAGTSWNKISNSQGGKEETSATKGAITDTGGSVVFSPEKSNKPKIEFFVMSYCPFGNQAEIGLEPVANLLKDLVDWQPRYIVQKSSSEQLKNLCQENLYSEEACNQYVDQGYFPDLASCKERFPKTVEECLEQETGQCMATENEDFYCSLHGKKELNQNIREICAWNLNEDKQKWWKFVSLVNANCEIEKVDQCWQIQADQAAMNIQEIQECFNKNAVEILDKEIAITKEFSVTSSPTILINDTLYPPEGAYNQEGSATTKIGDQILNQKEYRSPEGFKKAICAAFSQEPEECQEQLSQAGTTASGSCN